MKKFFLLILLMNLSVVLAFENISVPEINSEYGKQIAEESSISSDEFDAIEKKIFNKTFGTDSHKNRLSRLEKEIFGMEQKGNEEERFENLITASDYYSAGYRQNQNITKAKEPQKIDPRDYIVNYNFDDNKYKEEKEIPKYKVSQGAYYTVPDEDEPIKKKSKIVRFFEDIADAITSGVVTGYTLPTDSFGLDPFSTINNLGGTNYIGVPQFPTYYPQRYISPYRYNRGYYPYISRYNHNYPPPPRNNYRHNPYRTGRKNYNTGSGVRIIH